MLLCVANMKYLVHLKVTLKLQSRSYQGYHQTMHSRCPALIQIKLTQYMKIMKLLDNNQKMLLPLTRLMPRWSRIIQPTTLVCFNCFIATLCVITCSNLATRIHFVTIQTLSRDIISVVYTYMHIAHHQFCTLGYYNNDTLNQKHM